MIKIFHVFVSLSAFALSGCATIPEDKAQHLRIDSPLSDTSIVIKDKEGFQVYKGLRPTLVCRLPRELKERDGVFSITLKKDQHQVTHIVKSSGRTFTVMAAFLPDKVMYRTSKLQVFTVDRVTLGFEMAIPVISAVEKGECELMERQRTQKK